MWIHWIMWTNLVCLAWNHEFLMWWRASETIPVLTQYDSCQTCSKLVTGRTREYSWKYILVERYQLWTSMTCVNWFRNGCLFAGSPYVEEDWFYHSFYHPLPPLPSVISWSDWCNGEADNYEETLQPIQRKILHKLPYSHGPHPPLGPTHPLPLSHPIFLPVLWSKTAE